MGLTTRLLIGVPMIVVVEDDLSSKQSRALLALHVADMKAIVPPGATFLGLSDLLRPEVTVWSAWEEGRIAGIGALKMLPDGVGEIKSMRTHPSFAGRGVGGQILNRIVVAARSRGLSRLSLETGTGIAFDAARALYQKHGFTIGKPYATHEQTDFNQFFHLELARAG